MPLLYAITPWLGLLTFALVLSAAVVAVMMKKRRELFKVHPRLGRIAVVAAALHGLAAIITRL